MMRQSSSSPRSSHACESPLAFPCTLGDLSVSSDVAKKPPVRPSLPPRACHPVRLPAVKLFDYVAGWADSGQERGGRRSRHFHSRSNSPRVSQGLRLRLSGVYSCIFLTHCKYRSTMVLALIILESQYRMPWLLGDGLPPFQRARGMAYSFAGPSRGVHRGSGEGACDKTRPHCLCGSLLCTGRLDEN